jgi:PAS domain S-box-containing protein
MTSNSNLNLNQKPDYSFENFFELSPDLLCIAGFDGFFKKINPAVSKLLGYTNEELYSKPISEFIYDDDREATAKFRKGFIKASHLLYFENRYLTKNGEIVWLSWTSLPIDDESLVYAIAKNVTHTKKLEEERNLLLTNITKINNDLKKITYTSSHDLRSPVNNMLSIFNLMDVSKIEDPETLLFIDMLKSTSVSLRDALNDYVDSLILKDESTTLIEEINLNEALNTVLRWINSLVKNSKVTINIDFSELEEVKFNKSFLESIFLNLITNSIKYARPGHSPIITVYSKIQNGTKQLIFSDNGLGFDMDVVKGKIFGLHQKFHNHIDSKGIGLYLVHNHINSLGGNITVESKVNEGATFIISFKD